MMTKIMIAGQEITLPIYNLNIMDLAAPFLDNIQSALSADFGASISEANRLVRDCAGFIAAGTVQVQPDLTHEKLCGIFTFADFEALQRVVNEVLSELGI